MLATGALTMKRAPQGQGQGTPAPGVVRASPASSFRQLDDAFLQVSQSAATTRTKPSRHSSPVFFFPFLGRVVGSLRINGTVPPT